MKNVTSFLILLATFYIATDCAANYAQDNDFVGDFQYRVNLKTLQNENSVYNFESVCAQLCGEGFGGPICGAQCGQNIFVYLQNRKKSDEASELMQKSNDVCPILCDYGLGIPNCKCTVSAKYETRQTLQPVCTSLCSIGVALNGCGVCGRQAAVTDSDVITTTPNWAGLCIELCKTGDGGALCTCDLPPFF